MRLSYLSTVSSLAFILLTLGGDDCAPSAGGKRRREAGQNSPRSPSGDDEPRPKVNKPSETSAIGRRFEEMSESSNDAMEIPGNPNDVMEIPEVLTMNREEFSRSDVETKTRLTEGLSAKEWDKLLERYWDRQKRDEQNITILHYTKNYDEGRKLEMLKEALTSDLRYLFLGMSDRTYVPHTPEVIQLLERGLEVYPHLRHHILPTIYQIEYPTTKWHLDNTDGDVKFLKNMITMGWIQREAITGHLAEVAALYPPDILDFLLAKGMLNMDDLCTMKLYREVCGLGGKGYLKWAKDKCELRPDQGCIDAAVMGGHENVVDFIAKGLGMTMLPSQEAVNQAAANGMATLLRNKCHEWGMFPNTDGAKSAAKNGQLDVLKWLAAERGVYPGQDGADWAALAGQLDVLKWLASLELEHRVYPTQEGASMAAMMGQMEVLEWLATLLPVESRVYPDLHAASAAISIEVHLEMLKWLAKPTTHECGVYADRHGAMLAVQKRQIEVLKWLKERRIYPTQHIANVAAAQGHLEVLKWLADLEPEAQRVYPDQNGADWAAKGGYIDVLEVLARYEVYPSQLAANEAAGNRHLAVLRWMAVHGIYPSQTAADSAAWDSHLDVLEVLANYGVYPSQTAADEAACNSHIDVLDFLAKHKVFPNQSFVDQAARDRRMDVLEVLANYEVYPSQTAAASAVWNRRLDVLDFLAKHKVFPNQSFVDQAAWDGRIDVLEVLANYQIYPSQTAADEAAGNGHLNVLEFLANYQIYPSQTAADGAAGNGHLDVLEFLERHNVYPGESGANLAAAHGHVRVVEWLEERGIYQTRYDDSFKLTTLHQGLFSVAHDIFLKKPNSFPPERWTINFEREDGLEEATDVGGVFREWIRDIVAEIVSPDHLLFSAAGESPSTGYIFCETASGEDNDALTKYELAGRIFGRAFCENVPVGVRFDPIIYMLMLHTGSLQSFDYMKALGELEPEVYKHLDSLMNNPVDGLDLYFEVDDFSNGTSYALVEGGEKIEVTEENKGEYVILRAKNKLLGKTSASVEAFIKGFQLMVPPTTLRARAYTVDYIQSKLYGRDSIDVDEWEKATVYAVGEQQPPPELIGWFWDIMKEFTHERRQQMLFFTTSLSRVPTGGFQEIPQGKFTIKMANNLNPEKLPESQTCSSTLRLHPYESKEKMKEKLEKALDLASKGFGMG